jgi:chromosome segregation ATPase
MKKQLDEYENKIKKLILEFEETSKRHIKELNEVHEQYRGYKSAAIELEGRISQYKADAARALEGERVCKKELHRVTLENDELRERLRFIDQRYQGLVQRFGVSPEDLQEIEDQLALRPDDEA